MVKVFNILALSVIREFTFVRFYRNQGCTESESDLDLHIADPDSVPDLQIM